MARKLLLAGLAAGVLAGSVGCRTCCKRRLSSNADLPPPPGGFLGPPSSPYDDGGRIPPPSVPTTPPGGGLPPPELPDSRGTFRIDPGAVPPPVLPPESAAPPAAAIPPDPAPYRSAKPPKELLLPDEFPAESGGGRVIEPPAPPAPSAYLEAPVRPSESAKPADPPPVVDVDDKPAEPGAKTEPDQQNRSLPPGPASPRPAVPDRPPVGLSGYAAVPDKPGVYAGRRPALDGFDALKAAGFRTVVYIYDANADVSAARDLADKRGLRFVPVPTSPETLARAASAFNAAITDAAGRPTYVCDDDGLRAGFLWYLHFVTADLLNEDAARVRATPLGLRDDGSEEARRYWAAARNYLANR